MKSILTLLAFVAPLILCAQPVQTRTVTPVDFNALQYPNLTGNTRSTQPQKGTIVRRDGSAVSGKITFFKKKEVFDRVKVNTGDDKIEIDAAQIAEIKLDPKIYEAKYPNNFKKPEKNFQTGYIVLPTGEKLQGKVAQIRDFSDYDFFTYSILFLPEGTDIASSIRGGKLVEFGQQIEGTMNVWDGYADGYLLRMTDGRYRLGRNPYSKTKNEFFTGLKNMATDSLAKQASAQTLAQSVKDGKNVNESIEKASEIGNVTAEVLGSIDISRKEYLIFDTQTKSIVTVNKDTYNGEIKKLTPVCAASQLPELSWDKLIDYIKALNTSCD